MFVGRSLGYTVVLMLSAQSFLSSCTAESYDYCPEYPVAGPAVAAELEKIPPQELKASWEWIGRVNKLRQELELCRELTPRDL